MGTVYSNTEDLVNEFICNNTRRSKIVANLVNDSNRFLLNIPSYGIARTISNKLKNESYSAFYEFEKFIAKTLHPILSSLNLNIIADLIVNRQFYKKYEAYRDNVSHIFTTNKEYNMNLFENIITEMVKKDGHYMVIKFYDLILSSNSNALTKILRPIEPFIINMKNNLTENEVNNIKYVNDSFNNYIKKFGKKNTQFFIKRMEWDEILKKYINDIHDSKNDSPSTAREGVFVNNEQFSTIVNDLEIESIEPKVIKYARFIKKNFLDKKAEHDEQGIENLINNMDVRNKKTSGDKKGHKILNNVLKIWLENNSIEGAKKKIIQNILDKKYASFDITKEDVFENQHFNKNEKKQNIDNNNISANENILFLNKNDLTEIETIDDITDVINNNQDDSFEHNEFEISETQDDILGELDIKDNQKTAEEESDRPSPSLDSDVEASEFDIQDESTKDDESIEISFTKNENELDSFEIKEENSELGNEIERMLNDDIEPDIIQEEEEEEDFKIDEIEITNQENEVIDSELKKFIDDKREKLENLKKDEFMEIHTDLQRIKTVEDKEEKIQKFFHILNKAVFEDNRTNTFTKLTNEITEEDDFYTELFNHLYKLSKKFTNQELKKYTNFLIEKFNNNTKILEKHPQVIDRLKAYRNSILENPTDLLQEVHSKLNEIQNKYRKDNSSCVRIQYIYLDSCLKSEKYLAIKRTIITIIENILAQKKSKKYKRYLNIKTPRIREILEKALKETNADPFDIAKNLITLTLHTGIPDKIKKFTALKDPKVNLEKLIHRPDTPKELSKIFYGLINTEEFINAYNSITRSGKITLEQKIYLLDGWLKNTAEERGWFDEDKEKKTAKINNMIQYYQNFLEKDETKNSQNKNFVESDSPKSSHKKKTSNMMKDNNTEITIAKKKKKKKEDRELTKDERIYQHILNIIKSFGDNVEKIEPLLNDFIVKIPEELRTDIQNQIDLLKQKNISLIDRTIAMIDNTDPDIELIEEIRKSSSSLQYIWNKKIIEKYKVKNLEDVFKIFEKEKEFYKEISRIVKIIKINNKNDLLKTIFDQEIKVIDDISQNMSDDGLKKLRSKTSSRKNKDKIKLFRDLLTLLNQDNYA